MDKLPGKHYICKEEREYMKFRADKDYIDGFLGCREDAVTAFYSAKRRLFWGTIGKQYCSVPLDYLEDAYSDAIITLKENILRGKFTTDTGLDNYFMRIALNKVHEQERRFRKLRTMETGDDSIDGARDASESNMSGIWEKLDRIIESLAEKCRELIRLHYLQRLKLKDIAEKLGYANEQVAKNKHNACKKSMVERANAMNLYEDIVQARGDEFNYATPVNAKNDD